MCIENKNRLKRCVIIISLVDESSHAHTIKFVSGDPIFGLASFAAVPDVTALTAHLESLQMAFSFASVIATELSAVHFLMSKFAYEGRETSTLESTLFAPVDYAAVDYARYGAAL
jgi:hypothetical protein